MTEAQLTQKKTALVRLLEETREVFLRVEKKTLDDIAAIDALLRPNPEPAFDEINVDQVVS